MSSESRLGATFAACRADDRAALIGYLPAGYPDLASDLEMARLSLQFRTVDPIVGCSNSHLSALGLLFANSAAAIKKNTVDGQSGTNSPMTPHPTATKPITASRILNRASHNAHVAAHRPRISHLG